jgi:hypothetical protein
LAARWVEEILDFGVVLGCIAEPNYMAELGYMVELGYMFELGYMIELDCNFEQRAVAQVCKVSEG